jgi:hypothetical protein
MMITQARIDAERSDIRQEAEEQIKLRLRDLLRGDASKLILRGQNVLP